MTAFGYVLSLLRLNSGHTDTEQARILSMTTKGLRLICNGDIPCDEEHVKRVCEAYELTEPQYDLMYREMSGDIDVWIANLPSTPTAQVVRTLLLKGIAPQNIAKVSNISIAYLWAMCIGTKPEITGFYDRLNAEYGLQLETSTTNSIDATNCTLQQRALLWLMSRCIGLIRKSEMEEMIAILDAVSPSQKRPSLRVSSPINLFLQSRSDMLLPALNEAITAYDKSLGASFSKVTKSKQFIFSDSDLIGIGKFLNLSVMDMMFFEYCNKLSESTFYIPVSIATITVTQADLITRLKEKIELLSSDDCEHLFKILHGVYSSSVGDVQGRRARSHRNDSFKGGVVGMFVRDSFGGKMPSANEFATMIDAHSSSAGRFLRGETDINYDMFVALSNSCHCDALGHELLRYACYINRRRIDMDMYGANLQQKLLGEQFQSVMLELNQDEIAVVRKVLQAAETRRFHREETLS
jgi:hypothetical protein